VTAEPTTDLIPDGLDATLVLLRHGETTAIVEGRFQGQSQVSLSDLGQRQAARAAARLAAPHDSPALPVPVGLPREIVHSPLARTAQTAEAVAAALGGRVPLRPEDGLREIGQGEWEGRLGSEIAERWGDILSAWRLRPAEAHAPGGESLGEVQARLTPALRAALERLADGAPRSAADRPPYPVPGAPPPEHPWSIVVAHDGVFKVLLLTLFGLPLERFWLFPFALCGISIVDIAGGRPRLRAHNLTEHLAPLLEERAQAATEQREKTGAL
jgi:probable phosphoglycerate mutase